MTKGYSDHYQQNLEGGVEPPFKPVVVTRNQICASIAERWKARYSHTTEGGNTIWGPTLSGGRHPAAVYAALKALGDEPTPEQIDAAIGSPGWTKLKCDLCGADVDAVVVVRHKYDTAGEEGDESTHTCICFWCTTSVYMAKGSFTLYGEPLVGEPEWAASVKCAGEISDARLGAWFAYEAMDQEELAKGGDAKLH